MNPVAVTTAQEGAKGRMFGASLLAWATADALWDAGDAGDRAVRPVWAVLAGARTEMIAFVANLRCGRPFGTGGKRTRKGGTTFQQKFEFLRSVRYEWRTHATDEGAVVQVFLPDLFRTDPGLIDPSGVRFVVLPPAAWVTAQAEALGARATQDAVRHVARLGIAPPGFDLAPWVPLATLFAERLERRIRFPFPPSLPFQLQVMAAMLKEGLATFRAERGDRDWFEHAHAGFVTHGLAQVGIAPGVACAAPQAAIEALLVREIARAGVAEAPAPRLRPRLPRTAGVRLHTPSQEP